MGLFASLFGCGQSDELSRAALDVVQDDLHVNSVWPGDDKETIEAMQARIDKAREWTKSLTDRRAADAYDDWLKFYQNRVNEARDELTTHARKRRLEAYDVEMAEKRARANETLKTLPRPNR